MKVTVDTNFFISATQWDNSVAHKLLLKLIAQDIEIFTTKDIMEEFSRVLARDFKYNEGEINKIIENILIIVKLVEINSKVQVVKEDPEDDKILACALDSNSTHLITYDQHLLKLKEFQGIKIVTPEDFFKIID